MEADSPDQYYDYNLPKNRSSKQLSAWWHEHPMNKINQPEVFHTVASRQQQLCYSSFPITISHWIVMSMFLSFQEQSLIHQHLLIKQNLSLYPAAQHPYNTFTSLNHPWPRDHLPNPEQPYNQAMSTINCKSAAFYIFKSSTALTSYFLWDKKQPFQGDWQGNWHDFTKEQWNPFQGTHQSQVGILCLTILLFLLHQAEHFIKHIISRSMTSIYWQPSLECELHLDVPSQ